RLPIEWYEELLRYIKSDFPTIHIHAFSPPEFIEFDRFFNMDVRQVIRRFKAAGLDTIPGGGGEIFAPRVRKRIGIGKCTGDDWLRVMRVAHEEGMNTSCTMLIGHIEFVRERIEHMSALRDMQDYALSLRTTGVSTVFGLPGHGRRSISACWRLRGCSWTTFHRCNRAG